VQPGQHTEFPSDCNRGAQAQNSYQVTPVSTYQGIQVSYVPRANFELYTGQINQPQQGETVRSISGLGDAALVHSSATTSVLYVRKEDRVISVAVSMRPAPAGRRPRRTGGRQTSALKNLSNPSWHCLRPRPGVRT
jgi:hypothetical protein